MKIPKDFLLPLIISLSSLVVTLVILPFIALYLFNSPRINQFGIFEAWNIWDAPHYLDIATNWYQNRGDDANWIVFLPLFPIWVSALNSLTPLGVLYSAFTVSALAAIATAITFYKLVRLDENAKTSFFSTLLLFIFPTSFFLFLPYPESLFLLLILLTFFNLRRGNFITASIFAMLATATKIAGLALIPVIFMEILLHHIKFNKRAKLFKVFLAVNLPILGFLFYLLINYQTFGDIFYFQKAQSQNWNTWFYPVIPAFKQAIGFTSDPEFETRLYLGFGQIAAFLIALATIIYSYFKLRKSYFIFSLAFFIIYSSMSYWLSYPRYLLSLFPLFIMLGKLSGNRLFLLGWSIVSLIFLFILATIALEHGSVL